MYQHVTRHSHGASQGGRDRSVAALKISDLRKAVTPQSVNAHSPILRCRQCGWSVELPVLGTVVQSAEQVAPSQLVLKDKPPFAM